MVAVYLVIETSNLFQLSGFNAVASTACHDEGNLVGTAETFATHPARP